MNGAANGGYYSLGQRSYNKLDIRGQDTNIVPGYRRAGKIAIRELDNESGSGILLASEPSESDNLKQIVDDPHLGPPWTIEH